MVQDFDEIASHDWIWSLKFELDSWVWRFDTSKEKTRRCSQKLRNCQQKLTRFFSNTVWQIRFAGEHDTEHTFNIYLLTIKIRVFHFSGYTIHIKCSNSKYAKIKDYTMNIGFVNASSTSTARTHIASCVLKFTREKWSSWISFHKSAYVFTSYGLLIYSMLISGEIKGLVL
jgi:hypothetical protein